MYFSYIRRVIIDHLGVSHERSSSIDRKYFKQQQQLLVKLSECFFNIVIDDKRVKHSFFLLVVVSRPHTRNYSVVVR